MKINKILAYKRLFFYWTLNNYICSDIIEKIILIIMSYYDRKPICKEIIYKIDFVKEKTYYQRSWSRININILKNDLENIIDMKRNFFYNRPYYLPFISDHDDYCRCELCFEMLDYPRYIYLLSKIKNKKKGYNSKSINNWYIFLYGLFNTPHSNTRHNCGFLFNKGLMNTNNILYRDKYLNIKSQWEEIININ